MNTILHRSPAWRPNAGRGLTRLALVVWSAVWLGGVAWGQGATDDVGTWLRDGNFYYAQGDCALAQYFFQEALKRDEGNVAALVGKGRALGCQGAFGSAVESFRAAIDLDPAYVPAYVQLALAYQNQYLADPTTFGGRLAEAIDVLRRAEGLAPADATVQNTKGIIFYEAGDLEQARITLERAVELATAAGLSERERSVIQVNLGKAYRDLGQLPMAQTAFRRAVVLDPASASAHNNLGNVNFRLDDCAGAEYELAQAVSLAPRSLSAASQLAIVLFECGDVSGSIPRFEQALTLEGSVFAPPLYTYLSRAYLVEGRVEDAVRRAQQGALLPPESADAHFHLGRSYVARNGAGDSDAARRAFERALELDPGMDAAREALNALR
ncbi:MAG: tetratricopeptide repeat protein [bacterium]|nr:tetratricopeptide repeat protein [bacterium]